MAKLPRVHRTSILGMNPKCLYAGAMDIHLLLIHICTSYGQLWHTVAKMQEEHSAEMDIIKSSWNPITWPKIKHENIEKKQTVPSTWYTARSYKIIHSAEANPPNRLIARGFILLSICYKITQDALLVKPISILIQANNTGHMIKQVMWSHWSCDQCLLKLWKPNDEVEITSPSLMKLHPSFECW